MGTNGLIEKLEEQPEMLEKVVKRYGEQEFSRRPEGKWSAKEILGHLSDCEMAYGFRIRMALAQSGNALHPFDQELWVKNLQHQEKETKELVKSFERLRKANLVILKDVKDDEWERFGMHTERGKLTVRNLAETLADHFERHLMQVEKVAGQ